MGCRSGKCPQPDDEPGSELDSDVGDLSRKWTPPVVRLGSGEKHDATPVEITPAPRSGHIWVPGRYEARGTHEGWVSGHWIKDDYERQIVIYNNGNGNGITTIATGPTAYETRTTTYATGPMILRDSQGNIIPTDPSAYPISFSGR